MNNVAEKISPYLMLGPGNFFKNDIITYAVLKSRTILDS